MWLSAATLALLVVTTTVIHYEVLRGLGIVLPRLSGPPRAKLVVVILATFVSHGLQIVLYGVGFLVLVRVLGIGGISGSSTPYLTACLYFSAETYTSLGFGDIIPTGAARLLAGGEALNGLLLIGWSASYTYISMERFWRNGTDIDVDQYPCDPSGEDRAAFRKTGGVERVGRR